MEGLLYWGFFGALVGALIGKYFKDRAGVGALLGLFLGPLGWLLALAISDQRPKCPECGGVVVEGAKRCKNCGVEIHRSGSFAGVSKRAQLQEQSNRALVLLGAVIGGVALLFLVLYLYVRLSL